MRLDVAETLAGAWAMFRRDRALLLGLAGPIWLLPALALLLLVPGPPAFPVDVEPGSPQAVAAVQAMLSWAGTHGGWFVAAAAIGAWGTLALFTLYLAADRPDLATAFARAARLWPRFVLLNAITALPIAAGLRLWYLPGLYVLARVMLAGPALVAEAPLGAWRAIVRGVRLSRGASLPLTALVAATLGIGALLPQPLLALDTWLRAQPGGPNPVAVATVDLLAAAIATVGALASALVAVAAYRRLASRP